MINLNLKGLLFVVTSLEKMKCEFAKQIMGDTPLPLSDEEKQALWKLLEMAHRECGKLGLVAADHRIARMADVLRTIMIVTHSWAVIEISTLAEAIEDDAEFIRFYHYPKHKAQLLLNVPGDWKEAIAKFPDLDGAITAAVDCYAMGQNLASVFHLMRVVEIGVQRLGKKLGVSLTAKTKTRLSELTWHNILDGLNPKLKALPQMTLKQRAKHEQLSAIQSYLYGVKDAWRNPTMHPRSEGYTDLQTLDLINHVRAFMNGLAEVI